MGHVDMASASFPITPLPGSPASLEVLTSFPKRFKRKPECRIFFGSFSDRLNDAHDAVAEHGDDQWRVKYCGLLKTFMKLLRQQPLLGRLAGAETIAYTFQELNSKLDDICIGVGLSDAAATDVWMANWSSGREHQTKELVQLVTATAPRMLIREMSNDQTVMTAMLDVYTALEVTTPGPLAALKRDTLEKLRVALDLETRVITSETVAVDGQARNILAIFRWFIPERDVEVKEGDIIGAGSYGTVTHGTWRRRDGTTQGVVVKSMYDQSIGSETSFLRQLQLWYELPQHDNIIHLHGGCHRAKQPFFVCENAPGGNFIEFFNKTENQHMLWPMFLQVAQGLQVLHSHNTVHDGLKSTNILVGENNTPKISDFDCSRVRALAASFSNKSVNTQSEAVRWKPRETLVDTNNALPSFKSDVYSLGMCIIESKTQGLPFKMCDDDEVMEKVMEGVPYERPDEVSDEEWNVISQFIAVDIEDRPDMSEAITLIAGLVQVAGTGGAYSLYTSYPTKTKASWLIRPSELELIQFVHNDHIGGDFHAKWLDADVAVKLYVADAAHSPFEDEVRLWKQLRHPNAAKLYGACDAGPLLKLFVCEYARMGSLQELIGVSSVEKPAMWKYLLYNAALGLEYLHERGIVHGDLRCSNILIGGDGLAKLSNFGRSGLKKRPNAVSNVVVGSKRWQAPEVLEGKPLSYESDVYSLGMCIVEASTGSVPWSDKDENRSRRLKSQWDPEVNLDEYGPAHIPGDARELVSRMCCRDPHKRTSLYFVVCELERLADKESSYSSGREHEPPSTFDGYGYGKLKRAWEKLQRCMETCDDAHYRRVFDDIRKVCDRLQDTVHDPTLLTRFHVLLTEFYQAMNMPPEQTRILRLSSTRATTTSLYAFQWRINALLTSMGGAMDTVLEREVRWQQQINERTELFVSGLSDTYLLLQGLKSVEERAAFIKTLKAEMTEPLGKYTPDQLSMMHKTYDDISNVLEKEGSWSELIPAWFIPWYEVIVDEWSCIGSGSFGSVYRAKWLDSNVVVKRVTLPDSDGNDDTSMFDMSQSSSSRSDPTASQAEKKAAKRVEVIAMFRREVDIWFGFSHPHVVQLFGACHVGRPFFVCEYATNGTLVSFLRKYPDELWSKLYEAALGVQHIHSRNVVHGDLKGNNIVIGSDMKAKVTDFGLSSFADDEAESQISPAWHWVAPECLLVASTGPTPESDVYSLGMCIVEALRVVEAMRSGNNMQPCLPWRDYDNVSVQYHATRGSLPPRPATCDDHQWELVKLMCAVDPEKRIKISTVVDELARLAVDTNINTQNDDFGDAEAGTASCTDPVDLESASEVIGAARELLGRLRNDPNQRDEVVALYALLWDSLEHKVRAEIDGGLDVECIAAVCSLVADAKVSTAKLVTADSSLISLAETTMRCYALRRRLDKLCDAFFIVREPSTDVAILDKAGGYQFGLISPELLSTLKSRCIDRFLIFREVVERIRLLVDFINDSKKQVAVEVAIIELLENIMGSRYSRFYEAISTNGAARLTVEQWIVNGDLLQIPHRASFVFSVHKQLDDIIISTVGDHTTQSLLEWGDMWENDRRSQAEYYLSLISDEAVGEAHIDGVALNALRQGVQFWRKRKFALLEEERTLMERVNTMCLQWQGSTVPSTSSVDSRPLKIDLPQIPIKEVKLERSWIETEFKSDVCFGEWLDTRILVWASRKDIGLVVAKQWYALNHPHVLTLLGYCERLHDNMLVTERLEYLNLMEYLRHGDSHHNIWKRLHEVALGLQYLHAAGIIHGNVMCSNILVGRDEVAKIGGSFFSCGVSDVTPKVNEQMTEERKWRPPEELGSERYQTPASDVYSFGMTINEAVTEIALPSPALQTSMEVPSATQNQAPQRPDAGFSNSQWQLVERMCANNPDERNNVQEVVHALSKFADEEHRTNEGTNELQDSRLQTTVPDGGALARASRREWIVTPTRVKSFNCDDDSDEPSDEEGAKASSPRAMTTKSTSDTSKNITGAGDGGDGGDGKGGADAEYSPMPVWYISEHETWTAEFEHCGNTPIMTRRLGMWLDAVVVIEKLCRPLHYVDNKTLEKVADFWYTLKHPNVLHLFGACHVASSPFYVCEYAAMGTLKMHLKNPNHESDLWRWIFDVGRGLHYMLLEALFTMT